MVQSTVTLTPKDYKSEVKPTWCPGCGDFGVLNAIYNSLATLKLPPDQTVVVSGIGCSSRLPHFVETFGIHSLHGRALPIAQGMKMARPDLTIVAVGGDGDLFSIGAGHLVHAAPPSAESEELSCRECLGAARSDSCSLLVWP